MKYFTIALVAFVGLAILNQAGVIHSSILDVVVGGLYNLVASIH